MIVFEVHLRSNLARRDAGLLLQPFPGCRFNADDNRWEWGCNNIDSLVSLARDLGMPLVVRPLESTQGDLNVLEVVDVEEEES